MKSERSTACRHANPLGLRLNWKLLEGLSMSSIPSSYEHLA
jgi:hypothetical protein